jgi:hypothetical protein
VGASMMSGHSLIHGYFVRKITHHGLFKNNPLFIAAASS